MKQPPGGRRVRELDDAAQGSDSVEIDPAVNKIVAERYGRRAQTYYRDPVDTTAHLGHPPDTVYDDLEDDL